MKKILITLGASVAVVAPITAVIACSDTAKENEGGQDANTFPWSTITDTATKIQGDNPFADVADDGIYMWDKTYDGTLLDNQTLDKGIPQKGIIRVGETPGWGLDNSIQLGKKDPKDTTSVDDAVYMVYDKDDSDGINMDNFTDTFFFEDTSIAADDDIHKVNRDVFGNVLVKGSFMGDTEYIKFQENHGEKYKGHINNYLGSQNNHVSVGKDYSTNDDFMKKMKEYAAKYKDTNPEAVDAILKYYGLKTTPEADGTYAQDPSILNHASLGFAPVYYDKPIFTYEKIFDNVIKITYHDQGDFQVTAAHFRLKQQDDTYKSYGSLSIGHNDWSSYYGHSEAKYIATKKDIAAPKVVTGDAQPDGTKVFADIQPIDGINSIIFSMANLSGMDQMIIDSIGAIPDVKNPTIVKATPNGPFVKDDMVKFDFNGVPTQAIFDGTEFTFKQ